MRVLLGLLTLALAVPTSAAESPAVAVTYFDNNTGDPSRDALGRGLADMLITDLSQLADLQVVERSRLNDLLAELDLAASPFIDPATAASLGQGLGARYVVTGSFVELEPTLRIDARLVDVGSGEVLLSTSVSGPVEEFFLLEKELALALAEGAGVAISFREQARLGQVATESFGAFDAWSASLEALDRGEVEEAREAVQRALQHDERFASAADLLADLEQRLQQYGAQREQLLAERTMKVLARLDEIHAAAGPYEEVPGVVDIVALTSDLQGARDGKAIAGRILDMGLPEGVVLEPIPGTRIVMNEWALWYYFHTSMMLGDRADTLAYGEALIQRYPTSNYASSVSMSLQSLAGRMQREEDGRAEAPRIRAEGTRLTQRVRCTEESRPEPRVEACWEWARMADEVGGDELERALRATVKALSVVADAQRLEQLKAEHPLAPDVDREIEDAREQQVEGEEAAADLEAAEDGRKAARALRDLVRAGRFEEAQRGFAAARERWPADLDLAEEEIELALTLGNLERAEGLLGPWQELYVTTEAERKGDSSEAALARYRASAGKDRLVRSTDKLRESTEDLRHAEADGVEHVADELRRVFQYVEAAQAYERLAHEFPEYPGLPSERALGQAASSYRAADRIPECRRVYEELVRDYPDSTDGESAKIILGTMPR
jgi:TolB-like protein